MLTDTDATGHSTHHAWDPADRLLSTTDPAGRMTTRIYDRHGRPTDSYGPALASCFNTTTRLPNGTCTNPPVPHQHTDYDTNIAGLAATYWDNTGLRNAPVVHHTGVGTGAVDAVSVDTTGRIEGRLGQHRTTRQRCHRR